MSDIRKIDLNLLIAFDALYDLRNVTRAADRLALTQPTVSGMLARLRDLFAAPRKADAVIVATGDMQHALPALAALEAGYHVLLEKPMAPTESECRQLVAAAERTGRILQIAHVLRYTGFYTRVAQLLHEGRIGKLLTLAR